MVVIKESDSQVTKTDVPSEIKKTTENDAGFEIGGAVDPLTEVEDSTDSPKVTVTSGKVSKPISSPSFPEMSFKEDEDPSAFAEANPFFPEPPAFKEEEDDIVQEDDLDENGNEIFTEDDDGLFTEEDDIVQEDDTFQDNETFAEDDVSLEIADLPVDADGVIDPITVPNEVEPEPELGKIPDVVLPMEEPVVEIDENDLDVDLPENAFSDDGEPKPIVVEESFKLPENSRIIVSKGDQIFHLGRVRTKGVPKFAESAFVRAVKSLTESKGKGKVVQLLRKNEKVALVGRSLLVEVLRDWRLPGTSTIFESHDLLQIVASKPVREGEDPAITEDEVIKSEVFTRKKEEYEEEKFKRETLLAYKRWKKVEKARKIKEGEDVNEDDEVDVDAADEPEKKLQKERAKKEAAFLARQKASGWL